MKNIILQVNYKKYNITMDNNAYFAFNYMNDIKSLKKMCKYAILNNEYDRVYKNGQKYLCNYTFISSYLSNEIGENDFILNRIDNDNFIVKTSPITI